MSSHEHVEHSSSSKKLALVISVLALCLAVAQTGAKSAQTSVITQNVEASNLWAFFQARTIRQTILRTAAEVAALQPGAEPASVTRQTEAWQKTVAGWDSDPKSNDGRKELSARAVQAEHAREHAMASYHLYEYSSALFEIAIVIVSAAVVTSVPALAGLGVVLGVCGLLLGGVGFINPELVHLP